MKKVACLVIIYMLSISSVFADCIPSFIEKGKYYNFATTGKAQVVNFLNDCWIEVKHTSGKKVYININNETSVSPINKKSFEHNFNRF